MRICRSRMVFVTALVVCSMCAGGGGAGVRPLTSKSSDSAIVASDRGALERVAAQFPFKWQGWLSGRDLTDKYPYDIARTYRDLGDLYLSEGIDPSRAYLLIGQSEAFARDYAGARATFEKGLEVKPSADLAYGVGWCILREANDHYFPQRSIEAIEKAAAAFERALHLDSNHGLALNSLAYCHYWLAVKTRPGGVSGAGDAVAWAHHVDAGIKAWERYLERFPASSGIYIGWASCIMAAAT